MTVDKQELKDEIERLEKELESGHFRALFDRRAEHVKQKRLKKLRKLLAELEGTAVVVQPVRRPTPPPEAARPKPSPTPKAQSRAPVKPAAKIPPVKAAAGVTKVSAKKPAKSTGSTAVRKAEKAPVRPATKRAPKPAARKKTK
jgi:hypothetical protein